MESAIKKDLSLLRSRAGSQVITSDRFRPFTPNPGNVQRKRELFFTLQQIVSKFQQEDLSYPAMAIQIQLFFEELVFAETGLQSLRHGLRLFLDRLCAEPVITKLMQYLFKQMRKLSNVRQSHAITTDSQTLHAAMHEIFEWYAERSASIENLLGEEDLNLNYDRIFNLQVLHDQKSHGFFGFEVLAGIALFGRAGQNLWLKVFVKENGEYILPHIEWNSWIDDTEIFTVQKTGEGAALSAIVPISPQTQRLIIDRLNVFVPYQALDFGPGKHNVEIEVCVYNEKGDRLLEASSEEVVSVPRNRKNRQAIISQQALGIWSKDFVSGDGISNLELACVQEPNAGHYNDLLRLRFDLEIFDRLSELLSLEVRFYNSRNGLIKARDSKEEDPFLAFRKDIYIDEIIFRRYDLELVIPRSRLSIEEDDRVVSAEVSVLTPEGRVLCGLVESCLLPESKIEIEIPVVKPREEEQKVKPKGIFQKIFTR